MFKVGIKTTRSSSELRPKHETDSLSSSLWTHLSTPDFFLIVFNNDNGNEHEWMFLSLGEDAAEWFLSIGE